MADTITANNVNAKPNKQTQVPQADIDFGDVAQKVGEQWTATPTITLAWTNAADFSVKTNSYRTTLAARNQTASTRPQK